MNIEDHKWTPPAVSWLALALASCAMGASLTVAAERAERIPTLRTFLDAPKEPPMPCRREIVLVHSGSGQCSHKWHSATLVTDVQEGLALDCRCPGPWR